MFAHLEVSTQYLLQEIFLFALQLSLFIMIPLLWYIISHKKVHNFFAYSLLNVRTFFKHLTNSYLLKKFYHIVNLKSTVKDSLYHYGDAL